MLRKGFTLIELLIVIGIIAILAGVVIFAVNPQRQFAQANDIERKIEILKILDSIQQYAVDHNGRMNDLLPMGYANNTVLNIVAGPVNRPGEIDLTPLVPIYLIPDVPHDPSINAGAHDTGYDFVLDDNKMITISAPLAEFEAVISQGRGS